MADNGTHRPWPPQRLRKAAGRLGKALGRVVKQRHPGSREVEAAMPKGARWLRGLFRHGDEGRHYRLYAPAHRTASPPLLVMLHGCTQTAEDFAIGTRMNQLAEEKGALVLYPVQGRAHNLKRCWNWYRPQHQTATSGEPALLAALVRAIIREYDVDASQVYLAGLSAGGSMVALLAQWHGQLFRAVAIHAGLPAGAARDIPSALKAMKTGGEPELTFSAQPPPLVVFHGTEDGVVHPRNGEVLLQQWQQHPVYSPTTLVEEVDTQTRGAICRRFRDAEGNLRLEYWTVEGGGHAWFGGDAQGSFTQPAAPDASRLLWEFFQHSRSTHQG